MGSKQSEAYQVVGTDPESGIQHIRHHDSGACLLLFRQEWQHFSQATKEFQTVNSHLLLPPSPYILRLFHVRLEDQRPSFLPASLQYYYDSASHSLEKEINARTARKARFTQHEVLLVACSAIRGAEYLAQNDIQTAINSRTLLLSKEGKVKVMAISRNCSYSFDGLAALLLKMCAADLGQRFISNLDRTRLASQKYGPEVAQLLEIIAKRAPLSQLAGWAISVENRHRVIQHNIISSLVNRQEGLSFKSSNQTAAQNKHSGISCSKVQHRLQTSKENKEYEPKLLSGTRLVRIRDISETKKGPAKQQLKSRTRSNTGSTAPKLTEPAVEPPRSELNSFKLAIRQFNRELSQLNSDRALVNELYSVPSASHTFSNNNNTLSCFQSEAPSDSRKSVRISLLDYAPSSRTQKQVKFQRDFSDFKSHGFFPVDEPDGVGIDQVGIPSDEACEQQDMLASHQSSHQSSSSGLSEFCSSTRANYVVQRKKDGTRYQGWKLRGLKHGFGKFTYSDGSVYEGQWQDGMMAGKGTLYFSDGKPAYKGYWKANKFQGSGVLYNENPDYSLEGEFDFTNFNNLGNFWVRLEGQFKEDAKTGPATLFLTNGESFRGVFSKDQITGNGTFSGKNRSVSGFWLDNVLEFVN